MPSYIPTPVPPPRIKSKEQEECKHDYKASSVQIMNERSTFVGGGFFNPIGDRVRTSVPSHVEHWLICVKCKWKERV